MYHFFSSAFLRLAKASNAVTVTEKIGLKILKRIGQDISELSSNLN
jgi:hypothetical protein